MKIVIKEEQQEKIKLPPFIYKAIVNKNTSIGDSEALPPFGDFGFEYTVTRKGFEEADEIINRYIERGELESKDVDYLLSVLSKKIERCKKIEKTLVPQLEKLCENIVNSTFSIPTDTIILSCKLVGRVKPKSDIRVMPENEDDGNEYDFEDVDEVMLSNKVILKRRFINSLIQGLSYWLSTDIDDWHDEVYKMNSELEGLWYDIKNISDYLLYTKKDEINSKHPNLLSHVDVKLRKRGKKTEIYSQGVIFPYLLRDTFRGLFELFSAHGLPKDSEKAMYIIKKADFLVAEPWDLRLGKGIIEAIQTSFNKFGTDLLFDTKKIPFFFADLCKLKTDEFNSIIKNFILGTRKGNIIAHDMENKINHDVDYQRFKDKICRKNIETSVIADGDFSKEELDGYVIQENGLCESQESKSISAAKRLLMNSFNCDEESADEEIRINLRNRVPILKTNSGSKFILGAARMFADGQLDEKKLNDIIAYIINKGRENEFDRNLNGLSCGEMVKMFSKELKNDLLNRKNQINSIKFDNGPQEYNIVRIDSFDDAIQYSKYCDWCITTHEDAYVQNSNDGIYQIYFCLRKGYKREKPIAGENAPLDNYGLSMISVIVDERGFLFKCTSRWNHSNGGSDYVMNENEISNLINKNFYEVFKPNNKWAKGVERAKRLLRKYDIDDVFDEVEDLGYGFYGVSYYERWNIINSSKRLISKIWFDSEPREFSNGYSIVSQNGLSNFIDFKGNFLFSTWFSDCFEFDKNGIGWVKVMKYYYPVNTSGKFLSNKGYDDIGLTSENGFICVYKDGKCNFLNNSLNEISTVWYDYATKFENGIAEVWLDNKRLYIDVNGKPVSNPITENLETEMMAYHGSGSNFDKFNHKKYLNTGAGSQAFGWGTYVTNDKAIANGYSNSFKGFSGITKRMEAAINDLYIKYYDNNYNPQESDEEWANYIILDLDFPNSREDLENSIDKLYKELDDSIKRNDTYLIKINKMEIDIAKKLLQMDFYYDESYLYEVEIPDDNGQNYLQWCEEIDENVKNIVSKTMKKLEKKFNFKASAGFWPSIEMQMLDGEELYGLLEDALGSDKAASLFLMQCGFDGIKYPSGSIWGKPDGASEDAINYVIFDANKVKIVNKTKV